MLKNISKLEVKINERTYQLLCDMESPVYDCRQALDQFDNFLQQLEENAKKAAEAPLEQESISENVIEDATMVQ